MFCRMVSGYARTAGAGYRNRIDCGEKLMAVTFYVDLNAAISYWNG